MVWMGLQWFFFVLVLTSGLGCFLVAVQRRYRYIMLGRSVPTAENPRRLLMTLREVMGHRKLLRDRRSGWMHAVLFYGFLILQLGAIDLLVKGLIPGYHLPVPWYSVFELLQEIAIVMVLLAVGYAAYRRYLERVKRLQRGKKPAIVLWFIASLMLSVWFSLGFERAWQLEEGAWTSPAASLLASAAGTLPSAWHAPLFYLSWWLHLVILLAFLIYIPQSKHFHLITAPVNLWLRRSDPPGRLSKLDLEDETVESFGVGSITEFSQKQLLDLYACVECGRCTNVCPASSTGKALSPMHLITKLRDHLTERGAAITSTSPWVPARFFGQNSSLMHVMKPASERPVWTEEGIETDITPTMQWQAAAWTNSVQDQASELRLIGEVITPEELWSCTTCRSCEEQCPVGNEHVDKIIDMRRYLVLMQGELPSEAQRTLLQIERQGNPWGMARAERDRWISELGLEQLVPIVTDTEEFDVLLFVGSMGSYDVRSRRVTEALVRLLHAAGVRFAVLGSAEGASGDTARRLGNELLFQESAQHNIQLFKKYGVRKIVTACPHTYNTFKHEYPDMGLTGVEIMHHTEILAELLRLGKLKPKAPVARRMVYHDSCYLGRYNGGYDAPRTILRAIPGVELLELERSRENGMCCGAGGGMMWVEERAGIRISSARAAQAIEVRPDVIGSACPYCLTMLHDGVRELGAEVIETADVAELLARSVFDRE